MGRKYHEGEGCLPLGNPKRKLPIQNSSRYPTSLDVSALNQRVLGVRPHGESRLGGSIRLQNHVSSSD